MSVWWRPVLAAVLALASTPVAARPTPAEVLNANTRMMDQYFACLAATSPANAREAIASAVPSDEQSRLHKLDFGFSMCLRAVGAGQMTMTPSLYRAGLARAMYLRAYHLSLPKLSDPAPVDATADLAFMNTSAEPNSAAMTLFTRCVVAAHPEAADAFVRAEPASTMEREQLAAMQPSFTACLTMAPKMTMTRQALREFLGYSLYVRTADFRRVD